MGEIKTKVTDDSVSDYIARLDNDTRKQDALALLDLFAKVTGEQPKLWGNSMIGYGQYHYKSERSSQEGDWPLTAFAPRKTSLSIYLMHGFTEHSDLLAKLGKHKTGMGCLYINKLSDVDMKVLEQLIKVSYEDMQKQNPS